MIEIEIPMLRDTYGYPKQRRKYTIEIKEGRVVVSFAMTINGEDDWEWMPCTWDELIGRLKFFTEAELTITTKDQPNAPTS